MDKYRVGDLISGEVVGFGSNGEGVVKDGAYPIFVPFAIKGEFISARIVRVNKDYAFAELVDVERASDERVKPKCPYYGRCGGCDLQHVSRECQLRIKRDIVADALRKIAAINVDVPLPVRLNDWEYRNKLSLPFGYNHRSKRVSLGFFEKRSHSVVPIKWCPLHGEWAASLIECVTEWANCNRVSVFDERNGKGVLRHLVARKIGDTLSIVLVINAHKIPEQGALEKALGKCFDAFTLYLSQNSDNTNVIMGNSVNLVYGQETPCKFGDVCATVSPLSFLQVNNVMRDALYDGICAALDAFEGNIVELYSGIGLLTVQLAVRLPGAHITAVEIVPQATEDANALMTSLGLSERVENVCADAIEYVKGLAISANGHVEESLKKQEQDLPDDIKKSPFYLGAFDDIDAKITRVDNVPRVLLLDPPRKGCDRTVLQAAVDAGFDRIIYVSCNPQTLARDLKLLLSDYSLANITTYDMFPQTKHVESVVLMSRIEK